MRSVVLAGALTLGLVQAASAADLFDLPILRGSSGPDLGGPAYTRWDGFYVGGQVGYQAAGLDFGTASRTLTAFILRNTTLENEARVSEQTVLPNKETSGTSYGAFAGYNMQWENAIFGVEVNYDRSRINGAASDTLARSFVTSDGYFNNFAVTAQSSFKLKDAMTFRARAGWSGGWFMPYMFGALAVARVDVASAATVDLTQTQTGRPTLGLNETRTEAYDGAFAYGYAAGIGADMALTANLFVRAEWEYMRLSYNDSYKATINTVRGGMGVKF